MERACKFKEENLERIRLNCRDGVAIQMKSLQVHFQYVANWCDIVFGTNKLKSMHDPFLFIALM